MRRVLTSWPLVVAVVVVGMLCAVDAGAVTLVPEPLVPADLDKPMPRVVDAGGAHRTNTCADAPTPKRLSTLPFGPGEQLDFAVTLLGVHAGDISMRLDPLVNVDGANVWPVRGRGRTDGVVATVGSFDVSMVAFLDGVTAAPTRMANRTVFRPLFATGPTTTREDAAFGAEVVAPTGDDGSQVNNRLDVFTDGRSTLTNTRLKTSSDVVDTLSIVYWLRARELVAGRHFCFELLHRKKLWQVEVIVGEVAPTTSPATSRAARRVDMRILRAKKGVGARPMTVWISEDADRLPLLLTTSEHIEVALSGWKRGRLKAPPAPQK